MNEGRRAGLAIVAAGAMIGILGACSPQGDSVSQSSTTQIDSAGVEVITSYQPAWDEAEGWQVDTQPSLRIGSADGLAEETLHGIIAARHLGDSVLVAQETEIRIYDPEGRFVRSLGGAGRGPGEFSRLVDVLPCAHGIIASELSPPRLTVFSPSGHPTTVELPPPATQGVFTPLTPLLGCTSDGVSGGLSGYVLTPASPSEITRSLDLVVHVPLSGLGVDSILTYSGTETVSGLLLPFGRRTMIAASDSLLYLADTGRSEFRVLALDGAVRRIVRFPVPERPVTPGDLARLRQVYLGGLPPSLEPEIRTRFEAAPVPDTMPYFSQLKLATDGTVWLQYYQPFRDEEVTRWTAVDAAGTWLGDVDLPSGFTPHQFATREVLGVWRDELGVEFVHRYEVR